LWLVLYVRYVAFKVMLLLSANLLSKDLSMPMLCKTSTNTHKTTLTQTLTNPVGEITQISPTVTTTLFHLMPLNFNPQLPIQGSLHPTSTKQPPQPMSNLESLMKCFITTQTKTNKALGELVSQLNSKFETMITHQKMMEKQIA